MRSPQPRARVVLIGPPGAGKSTVGQELARNLGVDFLDTDAVVEERSGRTISDIFLEDGEAHFRELEQAAVVSALQEHDGVVALGGGRSEEHTSELQSRGHLVCRLLLEKKKKK